MVTELISDVQVEEEILAYILFTNRFDELRDILTPDCFTVPQHREIYDTMCSIAESGEKVNSFNVYNTMSKQAHFTTQQEVLTIYSKGTYSTDAPKLARHLREYNERRQLWHLCNIVETMSNGSSLQPLEDIYLHIHDFLNNCKVEVKTTDLGVAAAELKEVIEANSVGDRPLGTTTGFSKIDEVGGFHRGDLIIAAGDTSMGKTAFALSVTLNAIKNDEKIAYYSLEMGRVELTSRLVAIGSCVSTSSILYTKLYPTDKEKVIKAIDALPQHNLLFDDTAALRLESIIASIRTLHRREGIRGAVVDYLQILNVNTKSRETQEQVMAIAARQLKNLARELNIWILALSQLNRDKEKAQPKLSRLRNSGQIAEAADIVILIYRPEVYGMLYAEPEFKSKPTHNTALIEIAKGRNIGLSKFLCRFIPEITYFYEDDIADEATQQATPTPYKEDNTPF